MSSIIAQQTKLDLDLVPKESRLDIEKCNGRIPRILTTREPHFKSFWTLLHSLHAILHLSSQLMSLKYTCTSSGILFTNLPKSSCRDFDVLSSKEDTMSFLRELSHTWEINSLNDRNKIGMHTSKDDYLISTLRFISANESTQIYGAILLECLTSLAMKESKVYKTYFVYATGAVPPMIARKFKKTSPSKKDSDLVPVDKEPVTKGKRVKRSIKKSSTKPATGIIIREPPVKTKSKRKEKVDVTYGKGIELLSEVALTEEAQMKEVRKKSLRDFYKLHFSGFGTVSKKPPRVDKITPPVISEGTVDKPGVPDVTKDESTESESVSWGNDKDDNNDENDSENEGNDDENKNDDDKTPFDKVKDDDDEDDDDDKSEGDEDRGMDDTTNQFSDDVQDKKADDEMMDAQPEKENLKIT
nr:hypothetical protein [Tanacetum cinerariifolium]